jgi:4-aminobutyrate aminotransferase-like enzyme
MKAENAWIQGVDGRTYIDFAGGIGTLATGHRHPGVINAVKSI